MICNIYNIFICNRSKLNKTTTAYKYVTSDFELYIIHYINKKKIIFKIQSFIIFIKAHVTEMMSVYFNSVYSNDKMLRMFTDNRSNTFE